MRQILFCIFALAGSVFIFTGHALIGAGLGLVGAILLNIKRLGG